MSDSLMPTLNSNEEQRIVFKNVAPEDKEWSAHVDILNKWTTTDRYLREIIIYARSGKHYPTDMHVDLIEQVMKSDREAAIREAEESFEWRDKNARLQELLDLEHNGEQRIPAYLKKRIRHLRQQLINLTQQKKG